MAHSVELSKSADQKIGKVDAQSRKRILKFLYGRLAKLGDTCSIGQTLHRSQLGEFWKYRVFANC